MADGAPGFRRALQRLQWQRAQEPRWSGPRRSQRRWHEDPWFQAELSELAPEAAGEVGLSPRLADEVADRATRLFGRRLEQHLEQCFPGWLPTGSFRAWARGLMRRDCLAAAQRLARTARGGRPLPDRAERSHEILADRVYLNMALDHLPKVERVLLQLFLNGLGITQSAALMGLSRSAARRVFWLAVEHLLDVLSTDRRAI